MDGGVGMKFRTRKGILSLRSRTVKGARIQQLSVAKVGKAWLLFSKSSEVMKPDADASKNNIQNLPHATDQEKPWNRPEHGRKPLLLNSPHP